MRKSRHPLTLRRACRARATVAPVALAVLLALGAQPGARAQSAAAGDAPVAIAIAAQPLSQALTELARQTGATLVAAPALLADKAAPAVSGRLSARQALERLLAGSGLVGAIDDGVLTVRPAPPAGAGQQTTLQTVTVSARAQRGGPTEGSGSYTARAAATATRLGLSLRETPQSVSVVTRQQIEDRNFVTLGEAMEMATGVTGSTAFQGGIHQTARGFSFSGNLIDGLPNAGGVDTGYEPNLAFYDRVEILRGAAGLVAEAGSAGGVVNLVRKRPAAQRQLSVGLRTGAWRNHYVELDGSSPLNDAGTVRGRMVLAYLDRETHIDDEYTRRPMAYGIVEADLGPETQLHVGVSREHNDRNMAIAGLPRYADGGDLGLPRSSRGYSPAWNSLESRADPFVAGLEHAFGGGWDLKLGASQQNRRITGQALFSATGAVSRETLMNPGYGSDFWGIAALPHRNRGLNAVLSGRFDALGREHDVIVGASWAEDDWGRGGRTAWRATAPAITDTVFDFDPGSVIRPAEEERLEETSTLTTSSSVYATARLSLAEPLKLILGARLSWVETENYLSTGTTSLRKEGRVVTPYAGLTYDLDDRWSLYASYADIFRVQNTMYTAAGEALEPVVGANYEAGLKGELYGGRLNTSLALFRVVEENRAQIDPDNPSPCAASPTGGACYLAEGRVRGQGLEAELSGEILPGWQALAGYTYLKTKYLRDRTAAGTPSANEGRAFRSLTPEHLFKLWTTYRLPGSWGRLDVGGGVTLQSDIYTQSGDVRVEQGGYAVWHARVGYRLSDQWKLALSVGNLFDKHYYARLGSASSGNIYGEPRSWVLTLRGSF